MFFSAFPPFFPIPGFYPPYLSPVCSTPGCRLLAPWVRTPHSHSLSHMTFISHPLWFSDCSAPHIWLSIYLRSGVRMISLCVCVSHVERYDSGNTLNTSRRSFHFLQLAHWRVQTWIQAPHLSPFLFGRQPAQRKQASISIWAGWKILRSSDAFDGLV